jgi:RHS repeat-associated protein
MAFAQFHYYPFGSQMPGRKFTAGTGYRYGFNGKENDNEVKGEGNQQDYKTRIYDPRVGKFLSVDPIAEEFPALTPYQFASNQPIESIDMDGMERIDYRAVKGKDGVAVLSDRKVGPTSVPNMCLGINWGSIKIQLHLRVEYNGQHYIFADGRYHEKLRNGTEYGQHEEAIHCVSDLNKFVANPDDFIKTNYSEEEVKAATSFNDQLIKSGYYMDKIEEALSADHALGPEDPEEEENLVTRLRPITVKMQPKTKPSTSAVKPAAQQKAAASLDARANTGVSGNTSILKPLGRGSTGRTAANNLNEKLSMEEIKSNPNLGSKISGMAPLSDSRWSGWTKMQYIKRLGDGTVINIHYNAQMDQSGKIIAVDDFKFKSP